MTNYKKHLKVALAGDGKIVLSYYCPWEIYKDFITHDLSNMVLGTS